MGQILTSRRLRSASRRLRSASCIAGLALPLALAACNFAPATDKQTTGKTTDTVAVGPQANTADAGLLSHDPAGGAPLDPAAADDMPRPLMQAQVALDRLGFTPGVVDGKTGLSTKNAIMGFQEASQLPTTGELDTATKAGLAQYANIPATRVVTIPAEFAAGPFYKLPADPQEKAKLTTLGYESLDEKLAERFHTTIATLKELNPGGMPAGMKMDASASAAPGASGAAAASPSAATSASASASTSASSGASASPSPSGSAGAVAMVPGPVSFFHGGQQIRVPNVGGDVIDNAAAGDASWRATLAMLGVGTTQPSASKIVVSKSKGTLKAYDGAGKLVAMFTATMGSVHDPLPLGDWKILGVGKNPPFNYNPALFWDAKADAKKAHLPPGPNGPVGVVWIDLSKEHYGIHGTPNPETIGRAESHGCVRLTNWDVARLAQMVSTKTAVTFEA